jgi:hypothetical protein
VDLAVLVVVEEVQLLQEFQIHNRHKMVFQVLAAGAVEDREMYLLVETAVPVSLLLHTHHNKYLKNQYVISWKSTSSRRK